MELQKRSVLVTPRVERSVDFETDGFQPHVLRRIQVPRKTRRSRSAVIERTLLFDSFIHTLARLTVQQCRSVRSAECRV